MAMATVMDIDVVCSSTNLIALADAPCKLSAITASAVVDLAMTHDMANAGIEWRTLKETKANGNRVKSPITTLT